MPQDSKKRPGRPVGTTKVSFEHQQHIWLQVELLRGPPSPKSGRRRHSAFRASDLLEERGGLLWVVGGDRNAMALEIAENKESPLKKLTRVNLVRNGNGFQPKNSKNGHVFVSHKMQHGPSIYARYKEANKIFKSDPHVREAWTNYLCDLNGRPRPPQPRNDMWRPSFVLTASESN